MIYLWIAVITAVLVGLDEGWWTISELFGIALLIWFIWAWNVLEHHRANVGSESQRQLDRSRLRDDINQAGRDEWDEGDGGE